MKPIVVLTIFNLIFFVIIGVLLVVCKKTIKSIKTKNLLLKIVSILVVVIHYSSLYVDFFTNKGEAQIENNMILPVYPCNIVMWLLLIVAFIKDKESKIFKTLSEFIFIVGTICGLIGVIANTNFLNNPNLLDYDILKGLISHYVMIFGTIYLGVFNYVKIEVVRTTKSIFYGLMIFTVCGILINALFAIFEIPSVNAMFMLEPPFPQLPFLNYFTIGFIGLILAFVGLNIYEFFTLPKEQRWSSKCFNKRRK